MNIKEYIKSYKKDTVYLPPNLKINRTNIVEAQCVVPLSDYKIILPSNGGKIILKRKMFSKFIHSNLGIIEPRPAAIVSLYLSSDL